MNAVVQAAISNATVAAGIALAALVAARLFRRPSLTHALWVLVLVKLVTPPLFEVPFTLTLDAPAAESPAEIEPAPPMEHKAPVVTVSPPAAPSAPQHADRAVTVVTQTGAAPPARIESAGWKQKFKSGFAVVYDWASGGELNLWLIVWGTGSALFFAVIGLRLIEFRKRLRMLGECNPEIDRNYRALARRAGCDAPPKLVCVDLGVSPMLWGCGRRARIIFPTALWNRLSGPERDSLLMHELAHFQRGDQWVRVLEVVATSLFWWFPVVWLSRRELSAAEEECCDAWVVDRMSGSPRTYAEAIISALDFLAEGRAAMPPVRSGVGNLPTLKRRLRQIMERSVEPRLSVRSRWAVAAVALLTITVHPIVDVLKPLMADMSMGANSTPAQVDLSAIDTAGSSQADVGAQTGQTPLDGTGLPPAPRGWWNASPSEGSASVNSPDGRYRLSASAGHRTTLTDLTTGETHDLNQYELSAAAFSAGGHLIGGSVDGSIRAFDLLTGVPVSFIGRHQSEIKSIAVSPDGSLIAGGSRDGVVILWEASSGSQLSSWTEDNGPVAAVRFSPTGDSLAVAFGDWKASGGSQLAILSVGDGGLSLRSRTELATQVASLEFQADDRLVTASWDGQMSTMRPDGTLLGTEAVDKQVVSSAAFSQDSHLHPAAPQPLFGRNEL